MKVWLKIVVSMMSMGLLQTTHALLDLELTQGISAAIPIAILPFKGEAVRVAGNQPFTTVIDNDLQHSGEFRVVDTAGADVDETNWSAWRKQGVDYVLSGSIFKNQGDQYEVRMQLRSVFDKQQPSHLLLDESFKGSLPALRAVAHQISDDVYAKLTGVSGIFLTKIAYVVVQNHKQEQSYRLEVADADGFGAQTLLLSRQPIMSPSWSPDGKRLSYVSFEGHHAAVYSQDLATGKREVLSRAPGINGAPVFSPNGHDMALVLSKDGNPDIYLLDLQQSQFRALTSDWAIDTEPSFSADGSSLLFTSSRHGSPQIYEYSLLTGVVSRLTYDGNYNARASYTPDGQFVVMMHRDDNGFGIARLNVNNGTLLNLTQGDHDESPSVAPNGKMVIYATQYAGRGVLAQVSIDGKIKLRLPAREGFVREPAWSPFMND